MDIKEEAIHYRSILSNLITATTRISIPATPRSTQKVDGAYWTTDTMKNQYYSKWRDLLWYFHHFLPRPPALHILFDDGEPFLVFGGMYGNDTFDQELAVLEEVIQKQTGVFSAKKNDHAVLSYRVRRDTVLAEIYERTR